MFPGQWKAERIFIAACVIPVTFEPVSAAAFA